MKPIARSLRGLLTGLAGGALLAATAGPAAAQDYPNKPVRFIIPSSPGTTVDLLARILGTEMGKLLGQPVVVENKPGAAQIIALEHIAKGAPADGYTVGVVGSDAVALLPLTAKGLRFDPLADLVPIAALAEARYALTGATAKPWKNFNELMANARANPGKLNYGSSAQQVRFPVIIMAQALGLDIVHIPYAGGGPYLQAIAAGTIDFGITSESAAIAMGNRARMFAVTGQQRLPAYPDVPTFAEVGFGQIKGPSYAVMVRSGTPAAINDKLTKTTAAAMERPEAKTALARLLLETTFEGPEGAARKLAEQVKFYVDLSKKISITPE